MVLRYLCILCTACFWLHVALHRLTKGYSIVVLAWGHRSYSLIHIAYIHQQWNSGLYRYRALINAWLASLIRCAKPHHYRRISRIASAPPVPFLLVIISSSSALWSDIVKGSIVHNAHETRFAIRRGVLIHHAHIVHLLQSPSVINPSSRSNRYERAHCFYKRIARELRTAIQCYL